MYFTLIIIVILFILLFSRFGRKKSIIASLILASFGAFASVLISSEDNVSKGEDQFRKRFFFFGFFCWWILVFILQSILKSLVIFAMCLALSGAIYSRIVLSFALNRIFFSANENGAVKQNNQSDFKALLN